LEIFSRLAANPLFALLLHPSLPTALLIVTGISLFMLLTH
jgi:hypothetical protein